MKVLPLFLFIIFLLLFTTFITKSIENMENNENNEIPKKIFQTWHSNDLPPIMKKCVQKLQENHPDFEYHFYNEEMCRQFIKDNFDKNVIIAYDSLIPSAFKADLWRYCTLFKHGGIYLDIKYQCENNFNLNQLIKSSYPWVKENDPNVVYNGLLCCKPNDLKLLKCIQKIVQHVNEKYYGRLPTSPTGPDLLGNVFSKEDREKIHLLYYDENYPDSPIEKRGFIKDLNTNTIILSHYLEYRQEQKKYSKTKYWSDLWSERRIYSHM
jgi:mannosyltransferase OCH1-like enzyme